MPEQTSEREPGAQTLEAATREPSNAVFDSKLKRKVADRPHWITITLGGLSPLLAVIALVMSIKSLNTSRDSLRIGQRAYVQANMTYTPRPDENLQWDFGVTFKNTGNTPGELISYTVSAKDHDGCVGDIRDVYEHNTDRLIIYGESLKLKRQRFFSQKEVEESKECNVKHSLPIINNAAIGGKESIDKSILLLFVAPALQDAGITDINEPTIIVEYVYRDVFQSIHHGKMSCDVFFDGHSLFVSSQTISGD